MKPLPFQLARGATYAVGGILLAAGLLVAGGSGLWLWALHDASQQGLDGLLIVPLALAALLGCGIAGGGFFFLHRAQGATPDEPRGP